MIVLPKAHPSPSRMSGSKVSGHIIVVIWVIKTFFGIVLLHILVTLSLSLLFVFTLSVLQGAHPYKKSSLDIPNFLEVISSHSHSVVFLYFFALIAEEGFLISPYYCLELCIQLGISFLFSLAFHFSSFLSYVWSLLRQPFCPLAFLFIWYGFCHCLLYNHKPLSIVLQAFCLPDLIPWIYCNLHCIFTKNFI